MSLAQKVLSVPQDGRCSGFWKTLLPAKPCLCTEPGLALYLCLNDIALKFWVSRSNKTSTSICRQTRENRTCFGWSNNPGSVFLLYDNSSPVHGEVRFGLLMYFLLRKICMRCLFYWLGKAWLLVQPTLQQFSGLPFNPAPLGIIFLFPLFLSICGIFVTMVEELEPSLTSHHFHPG